MLKTEDLFDLEYTIAGAYLRSFSEPWQALPGIKGAIEALGAGLGEDYAQVAPSVWIHKTAQVAPSASVSGPCIIGPRTQVRHCAFIRGSALIGADCVVGNSVEIKNAILFDGVQVPHFNYVGDSILGHKAHMGAGAVTSNVKSDRSPVCIKAAGASVATGLKKFGALVGDRVEIGCNSVLNPGTVIGRDSTVYPLSCVRGVVPGGHIWKAADRVVRKEENHG